MRSTKTFLFSLLSSLLILVTARGDDAGKAVPPNATLVYVGTYTNTGKSKGIYLFQLQTVNTDVSQNILLVPLGLAVESQDPSFLELDPKRRLIFAVNEVAEFQGKPSGAVSAFKIDPSTGKLALINQVASMGKGPCHLVLDKEGKNLLVANYDSGTIAVIPVAADGKLSEASCTVQFSGTGPNKERQEGAHAHCMTLSPDNKFAFACDLGTDKIMTFKYDGEHGKLTPAEPAFASVKPGAGPRHMVFGKDGKFAYVINELDSTITTFAYDAATGGLKEVQTLTTLPGYYDGPNTTAEIEVNPSGHYLYASNRGHNSVVLFEIDKDKGTLTFVEEQGTGGKTPRHFGIEPSGKHLTIANQNSDTLLICRIDADNGRLKPSGVFADCPAPVCAKFLPPAGQ